MAKVLKLNLEKQRCTVSFNSHFIVSNLIITVNCTYNNNPSVSLIINS